MAAKPIKPQKQFVAIGKTPDGAPEALNTFDLISEAAACAAEFLATHKFPASAWVETVEVRAGIAIPCRIVEVVAEVVAEVEVKRAA